MNHDDLDALSIWIKHYPYKAEKALAQMRNATASAYARLNQTLAAVGDNTRQTAAAIEQLTQSLSMASTKDAIDTLQELNEHALKGDTIVIDTIPEETTKEKGVLDTEYNLTEVNSDVKFDWEEPNFTNMTDFN